MHFQINFNCSQTLYSRLKLINFLFHNMLSTEISSRQPAALEAILCGPQKDNIFLKVFVF